MTVLSRSKKAAPWPTGGSLARATDVHGHEPIVGSLTSTHVRAEFRVSGGAGLDAYREIRHAFSKVSRRLLRPPHNRWGVRLTPPEPSPRRPPPPPGAERPNRRP